jgi:serine O-acetyltransferase
LLVVNLKNKYIKIDPVWDRMRNEANAAVIAEPAIGGFIHINILQHSSFERALGHRVASKLLSDEISQQTLRDICNEAISDDPQVTNAARADVMAVVDRDPACNRYMHPLLYFKGFLAVQSYRISNWLWVNGKKDMAYFFQMKTSEVFGIDIHPAAKIGKGLMIDHGHSIVIGETSVVGDNVSMLHSVTLGGTGKEDENRHPEIGDGVMIGAGAKVLGNIKVGNCCRIAAGSVVLQEIPPKKTVAGVPARIVGEAGCSTPSIKMDQILSSD